MLNDMKNTRYIHATCSASHRHHSNCCYIREAAATDHDSPSSCQFEVTNVADVPIHIESFLKSHPRVQPSYSVDLKLPNAKSANKSLLCTLYNYGSKEDSTKNAVALNLTSIEAVRLAADCIDKVWLQDSCFAAPAKSRRHILTALSLGVNRMAVSYPAEVLRISSASKSVELVLSLASTADGKDVGRMAETIRVAKAKGMRIVGIALRHGWADEPIAADKVEEALVRLREAYDEAIECGHDVRIVDLGSWVARAPDSTKSTMRRRSCSVIMEDDRISRTFCESACDDDVLPTRVHVNALLDQYFPPSLGLRILAEHAQYLFPEEELLQKWYTTPKERRPAPSFHSFMVNGCTTKTSYSCSYRGKARAVRDSNQAAEPAAAQA